MNENSPSTDPPASYRALEPPPSYRALGKYQLVTQIGRGGMADVFLAVTSGADGIDERVVVKQLRADVLEDEDFRAMFLEEARLAVRMAHPHVVRTLDVGRDGAHVFLVMEFIDGQPWSRIRKRGLAAGNGGPPLELQLRILSDVLTGLHYVHELTSADGLPLNIVHRDVTPQNVLVTYDGIVKVVDFGIALTSSRMVETRMGLVKGKLPFMSPEHARGEKVDRRSDIFSVGVLLWEAITGERLWGAQEEVIVYGRLVSGDVPRCCPSVPRGVNPELVAICERALALDPGARFATAADMKQALEAVIAGMGPPTTSHTVGSYVGNLFADDRDDLHATVRKELGRIRMRTALRALPRPLQNPEEESRPSGPSPPPIESKPIAIEVEVPLAESIRPLTATMSSRRTNAGLSPSRSNPVISTWAVAASGLVLTAAVTLSMGRYRAEVRPSAPTSGAQPTLVQNDLVEKKPIPVEPAKAPPEPAPEVVELSVQVTPGYAHIFVDDVPQSTNPARVDLAPGPHRVRVESPGFYSAVREVRVSRDLALELNLRNQPPRMGVDRRLTEVAVSPFEPRRGPRPRRELDPTDPYMR